MSELEKKNRAGIRELGGYCKLDPAYIKAMDGGISYKGAVPPKDLKVLLERIKEMKELVESLPELAD